MSDVPQGEGLWQASDGKWYAPELHPDVRPAAPAQPEPTVVPPPDLPPVPEGDPGLVTTPAPTPPPAPASWSVPPAAAEPAHVAAAVPAGQPSGTAWIPKAIIVVDLAVIIITIGLVLING